jgi:hypothetical protein
MEPIQPVGLCQGSEEFEVILYDQETKKRNFYLEMVRMYNGIQMVIS